MSSNTDPITETVPPGLVGIEGMAETVWPNPLERPAIRTLRGWTTARLIPSIKLGRLRYYEPRRVAEAIRQKFEIPAS